MVDADDEEMRLAIELSKKTFEEEEQVRRLHEVNLISFENPEAARQQEKLTAIQQLLNSPVAYGWNQSLLSHSQSSGSLPATPYSPNPQLPGPSSIYQAAGAPPLPPRRNPPPSRHTTMPIQIPQRVISPPNSYSTITMLPVPGFSTPTSRPIQNPLMVNPAFVVTPSPRGTMPALAWKVQFSPMPSAHRSIDVFRNKDPSSNEASPSTGDDPNPYASPKRHELYLPYSMIKSPRRGGDADLIDLSSDSRDAGTATLDQIWREFDPLYVPPKKASMPSAKLERTTSLHENIANTHVPSPAAIKEVTKRSETGTPKARPPSTVGTPSGRPATQDWYTVDSIKIIEKTPDVAQQFERLTNRISKNAKCSQFFSSAIVNYMTTNAPSVKVSVEKDHTWPDGGEKVVAMTVETSTKIEALLNEILARFLDESQLTKGVTVKEYGLKEYGLDEFLPEESRLGQNIFVGKCLLMDKDVKLEIGRKIKEDQNQTSHILQYQDVQKNKPEFPSPTILDAEDIRNALVHLKDDMARFEKEIKENNPLSVAAASNKVKQHVKMLCRLLSQIEPVPVHRQLQKYLLSTEETVNQSRDDFIAAIHGLISAYCRSTMSRYNVLPLKEAEKPVKKIIEVDEKVKMIVNSVHNLRHEWLTVYQHFYVTTSLFHGTENLDWHEKVIPKEVQHDAFFPYVEMSIYAHFSTELRHCPREAKLMFLLWGVRKDVAENGNGLPKAEEQPLAVASLPMFDHNNRMRQGQLMVPLSKPRGLSNLELSQTRIEPWGGQPLLCSERDAVLVITLPHYDYDVVFPDLVVEHPCSRSDFSTLPEETQELLQVLMEATEPEKLQPEDRETLWERRQYLVNYPEALPLVLASVPTWGFGYLENVYNILEAWTSLSPVQAIQLLLPQYPDLRVRSKAVEWIRRASSDFLFNFLPQLVELLRFELYEDSALADFLLHLSYKDRRFAFELYWQLQQRVDHCPSKDFSADIACYVRRCQLLQQELLTNKEAKLLCHNICLQHRLVHDLDELQRELKKLDDSNKLLTLRSTLGKIDGELLTRNVRLPILPSFRTNGVDVQKCNIFNSNAKPFKIVFRGLKNNFSIIHKDGDDMRQDSLVLQMVRLMNDIWLSEKLDLRMITFRCTPVGYKKGMAELVSDCQTLCDIQKGEGGVSGVFKDDVLCKWLQKYNSSAFSYNMALDNFRRSCAGWCVATYVLGIGDRHNDNILLTTMGHVFHIDFGKYMGDWQMAAGFRRDRVPFVFTKEMYIVITGGDQNSQNYQIFIDHCCSAFNHLRKNYTVITNLIKIMVCSDIPGISPDSLNFVQKNLMLDLSDSDATEQFTQMINDSLDCAFTRWNFLIHTMSMMVKGWKGQKVGPEQDRFGLSFIPQKYTKESDGRIRQVSVVKVARHMMPQKVYLYQLIVYREGVTVPTYVYRSFAEFHELYMKLKLKYQDATPILYRGTVMRSNVKEVAMRRINDIKIFVTGLLQRAEIKDDPLVYTFFHNILRDNNLENHGELNPQPAIGDTQVLLELTYDASNKNLNVFVKHVQHLPILPTGQPPDSYVKTYLRTTKLNDVHSANSKRKTPIVKNSLNPTFNSKLTYDLSNVGDVENFLETHILDVSVWNAGGLKDNVKMYLVLIPLKRLSEQPKSDRRGTRHLNSWFTLSRMVQAHPY